VVCLSNVSKEKMKNIILVVVLFASMCALSGCAEMARDFLQGAAQGAANYQQYPQQYNTRTGSTNYTHIGNTVYGSDGTNYTHIGNTVYGSDGTSCTTIGNYTYCN
jgi:flagellar basal body-associated protein FliL